MLKGGGGNTDGIPPNGHIKDSGLRTRSLPLSGESSHDVSKPPSVAAASPPVLSPKTSATVAVQQPASSVSGEAVQPTSVEAVQQAAGSGQEAVHSQEAVQWPAVDSPTTSSKDRHDLVQDSDADARQSAAAVHAVQGQATISTNQEHSNDQGQHHSSSDTVLLRSHNAIPRHTGDAVQDPTTQVDKAVHLAQDVADAAVQQAVQPQPAMQELPASVIDMLVRHMRWSGSSTKSGSSAAVAPSKQSPPTKGALPQLTSGDQSLKVVASDKALQKDQETSSPQTNHIEVSTTTQRAGSQLDQDVTVAVASSSNTHEEGPGFSSSRDALTSQKSSPATAQTESQRPRHRRLFSADAAADLQRLQSQQYEDHADQLQHGSSSEDLGPSGQHEQQQGSGTSVLLRLHRRIKSLPITPFSSSFVQTK